MHELMTGNFNLEHFFELSPDGICIVGNDLLMKRLNPAFAHAIGYSIEELVCTPVVAFIHPEDRSRTLAALMQIKQHMTLVNFENRYLTKDGEVRWFSWTAIPIEGAQAFLGVAKDITYQRRLDEDRNRLLTVMTKSVGDLRQLTYATSHDLRSPVNNLLAVFSMLDVSKIQDPETRKFIDMLKLATDNLRNTLNTYLEMLSEKDVLNVSQEEVDLEDCLDHVRKSVESLVEYTGTEVRTDFSAFRHIQFNRLYLESIYLNLLTNSIKYVKAGSAPKVHVYTRIKEGLKQLVFSDEGQGFDLSKVKDRVFGLHQKFHDHADSKGIGLYLVHHHVTSMGGRIQLESQPGEGAKFIISFE